jgi:ssDNA-binding Zn-finger/Zn-ribbon topoisomerase 1
MNGTIPPTTTPPAVCPQCGGNVILKTGTKTDGSVYRFYGCSNFRDLGCRFTWRPPQQPAGFGKAVGNMLTKETFIQAFGILRGDLKKLDDKLIQLLNVSVIYPKDSPVGSDEKIIERKVAPVGEPPEDIPPEGEEAGDVSLKDL